LSQVYPVTSISFATP